MTTVGLVSAGEMGSALGADLRRSGLRVVGATGGRSRATHLRAERAGIELLDDLDDVLRASDVVLSVVPPQHAVSVMVQLTGGARRLDRRLVLADLNAVAPSTFRSMAGDAAGLELVDGALLGGPPAPDRSPTRLLLSGPSAQRVAELPWDRVEVEVLGSGSGMASAAKMCTGAVRKGISALVANALATAAQHGVEGVVEAELRRSLRRDPLVDVELAAAKAWRFVPEMEAVAHTQAEAGLDPALYVALAEVFRRLTGCALAAGPADDVVRRTGDVASRLDRVVQGLLPRDPVRRPAPDPDHG